ncbi:hypothetical protein B0H11DRAFT_1986565 [Mycena galericulata]|nr:hypothetical protein B0H11DRAFT_1986565 [Mycena galericulata]
MPARRPSNARTRGDIAVVDSEEDLPLIVSSKTVAMPRPTKRKKPSAPESELIEILSSDDEDQPRKRQATIPKEQSKQLQQEIRILQQKCAKLAKVEDELERTRKENGELKLAAKRSGKVVLDASQLEDHISCEICTSTMLTPYILSGCGHSYCGRCLVEWFGTCLAQHMAAHPNWRPTNQPSYHLLNPGIRAHPYIAAMMAQQGPQPEYTCPTCRAVVSTKPIEDYALKAIIQAVSGESSPKKAPAVAKRRGKGKAKAVEGPFDGFFGKDT